MIGIPRLLHQLKWRGIQQACSSRWCWRGGGKLLRIFSDVVWKKMYVSKFLFNRQQPSTTAKYKRKTKPQTTTSKTTVGASLAQSVQ